MPFTNDTFARAAFKNAQGLAHTSNGRDPANEAEASSVTLGLQEVFGDQISTSPVAATAAGVAVYMELALVQDTGNPLSYFAQIDGAVAGTNLDGYVNPRTGVNYVDNDRVGYLIPPKFGTDYRAVLRDSGVEIPPLAAEDWYFDYRSGIVTSETALGLTTGTIDGYVYIGTLGVGTAGSGSVSGTAGHIAFFDSATSVTSESGGEFTWNGTTFSADGAAVFNESGADRDFRVEGITEPNLLFVNAGTDRVGIGTDTPLGRLHVFDDVNGAVQIYVENPNAGSGALAVVHVGEDIATGNGTSFQYLGSGFPTSGLQTARQAKVVAFPNATGGWLWQSQGNGPYIFTIGNATSVDTERFRISNTEVVVNDNGESTVDFRVETNGLTHGLFVDGGNDAVGINESAPDANYYLEVTGATLSHGVAQFTGASSNIGASAPINDEPTISLHQSALTNNNTNKISFTNSFDVESALIVGHHVSHSATESTATGELSFWTQPSGSTLAERMRIADTGEVGIGASDPAYQLDVSSDSSSDLVRVSRYGGNTDGPTIEFVGADGTRASPNPLETNDRAGAIDFRTLWSTSLGSSNVTARIEALATQNHSTLNQGTELRFLATNDSTATLVEMLTMASGETAINQGTGGFDFRVRGQSTHDIFLQGSSGFLGLNQTSPGARLDIEDNTSTIVRVVNTVTSSASSGGFIELGQDDGAAIANNHRIGGLAFRSTRSASTYTNGAAVLAFADATWTSTSAPTRLEFACVPPNSTSRQTHMTITSNGYIEADQICVAWADINGTGSPTFNDQFGFSSVSASGIDLSLTFGVTRPDANYAVVLTEDITSGGGGDIVLGSAQVTTGFDVVVFGSGGVPTNWSSYLGRFYVAVFDNRT